MNGHVKLLLVPIALMAFATPSMCGPVGPTYDNNSGENGVQIHSHIAITMGNVFFMGAEGMEVKVDKTVVFRRCIDGKLRLCVHKSTLPIDPEN